MDIKTMVLSGGSKTPGWTARLAATLAFLGGPGIFLLAFLDSSVLSFPVVTDLLIMQQAMRSPSRMIYFAAMAVAGSLAGCIWLYWLAKKGGEEYYRRRAGKSRGNFRRWMERNAFACVFAASLLPPPMPFKPFVLVAGMTQVRMRTFVLALLAGRGLRYLLEGWLAIRYGAQAMDFMIAHKLGMFITGLTTIAIALILTRWIARPPQQEA
jgi:membrane protein YqaA with SNARE-associated domain